MQLKLIKYHPLFAYSVGDQFEVSEENTKILLDGKYAEPVGEASAPTQVDDVVEDASDKEAEAALDEAKGKSKSKKQK